MSTQLKTKEGCRSAGSFDAYHFQYKEGLEQEYKKCLYTGHDVQLGIAALHGKLSWSFTCYDCKELNFWREQ